MRRILFVLLIAGCGEGSKTKPPPAVPPGGMMPSPMMAEGINNPILVPASRAHLADDTEVVGIVVGGEARAYSIPALSRMTSHVVNDVIDGVPASVTFCDIAGCLRVFTGPEKGKALALSQMGRVEDSLLLNLSGRMIRQSTGAGMDGTGEPLLRLAHERTTWKEWKKKHPGTLAYDRSPRSEPGEVPPQVHENW